MTGRAARIAIVGAGVTGLAAAHDLLQAGYQVSLFEAADHAGGLAAGFTDGRWDWPLEKFYHHLFTSDKAIIALVHELGIGEALFFPRPLTSVLHQGKIEPFDSPLAWLRFPGFNLLDVARFGLVSAYLRFSAPWRHLEQVTADEWLRRWYGDKVYEMTWRPLLIGKFGPYYRQANMAWMWARLKVRSPRLGYFRGGFQFFVDSLVDSLTRRGAALQLSAPVQAIRPAAEGGSLALQVGDRLLDFDKVLVTTSPDLLRRMAPDLPADYMGQLAQLKSMGAVVLTLALRRQLMKDTYWLNIPAVSADKSQNVLPFLALVEHTNYIDRRYYGGDHIVYCGDYVVPEHDYFSMSMQEIQARFVESLARINKDFQPDWVRDSWLFRARYAQPVPEVYHSRNIPDLRTPLANLYFASMSQVYPWDRGTNFAVKIGREAANEMIQD